MSNPAMGLQISGDPIGHRQVFPTVMHPEGYLESESHLGRSEPRLTANAIRPRPNVEISDTELRARIEWGHRTTPHFAVSFDRQRFQDVELNVLTTTLERSYSSIFSFTHEAIPDRLPIYAVDRQATGLLGRAVHPHHNAADRSIYLVRSARQPIHSELISLVAHAMRQPRCQRHYGQEVGWTLMEDAFCALLDLRLTQHTDVFPFYGTEPDIIAHHVLSNGRARKLTEIWNGHTAPTDLERYIIAGAFFVFLADTCGDDRVVEFSKCDGEITDSAFKSFFGGTLAELESSWSGHLPTALMTMTAEERAQVTERWERWYESRS